jgi:hypothetical protein
VENHIAGACRDLGVVKQPTVDPFSTFFSGKNAALF